jgi:hypothetical protein
VQLKGGRRCLLAGARRSDLLFPHGISPSPQICDVGFVPVSDGWGAGVAGWGREKSSVFDHSGGDAFGAP